MNGRSWSEDFTSIYPDVSRVHDYSNRSWSIAEDYSSYAPVTSSPSSSSSSEPMVYPQATNMAHKCGYRTGKCFNLRAQKRNGKDHKLCDFHREKANLNQKKLDRKKRLRRFSPYEEPAALPPLVEEEPKLVDEGTASSPTRIDEAPLVLGFDEVEFFCRVMTPEQRQQEPRTTPEILSLDPATCRAEDPTSSVLDLLFKSEVMFFVDQM
ncbi:hypothetical protein THRCLA_07311 [Thraustotheca clavata]|uniref:Uncharacterized protein n=1 Tax=Thraustotheca clavata TaxID=74557 RepID=A0A1V9ZEC1_9STRA|nr:hypothetical protein THRCLA_07311 [Thraustotheca clavata]